MARLTVAAAALIAGATGTAAREVWGEAKESTGVGFKYQGESCDSYDDDVVYTAKECGNYDTGACAQDCTSGGWCYELCGTGNSSCSNGGGAICATGLLTDILSTCMLVESYNYTLPVNETWTDDDDGFTEPTGNGTHLHKKSGSSGSSGDSSKVHKKAPLKDTDDMASDEEEDPSPDKADGAMDGDHESLRMPKPTDPTSERKLAELDIMYSATGCDAHVYCEFCETKCDEIMHEYAKHLWGVAKWKYNYNDGGAGPMAMKLLNDLPALCGSIYPDGAKEYYETEGTGGVLKGFSDDALDRPYVEKHEHASKTAGVGATAQGASSSSTTTTTTTQDNIRNMKHVAEKAGAGAGAGSKKALELNKVNAPDARLPDGAVQASPEDPSPLMPDMAATEPGSAGTSGSSATGLAGAAVLAVAGVALVAFLVQRRRAGFASLDNGAAVYDAI